LYYFCSWSRPLHCERRYCHADCWEIDMRIFRWQVFFKSLYPLAVNFTSVGPTYLAEVSPQHIRGRIISLQQWSITWGVSSNQTSPSTLSFSLLTCTRLLSCTIFP
jgi:hypothetical protein